MNSFQKLLTSSVLTALILSACGGPTGNSTNPPAGQDFSVAGPGTPPNVGAGSTIAVPITVTRSGGFAGVVNVDLASPPAGVTATQLSISPSVTSGDLNIFVPSSVPTGPLALTLNATTIGFSAKTSALTLNVTGGTGGGSGGFTIATTGSSLTLPRKASAGVNVSITRTGGFTGPVTVGVSGLPSGVTASALTIPVGSTTGTLNLSATATATLSTAPVVTGINGSSTGVTAQSTSLNLTVRPGGGERFDFASSIPGVVSGILIRSFSNFDNAGAMIVQPDGKMLLGGSTDGLSGLSLDGLVMRFNPDGSLDADFGVGGVTRLSFTSSFYIYSLALQSDGRIIVGGEYDGESVVARLKINGALDTSFGSGLGPLIVDPTAGLVFPGGDGSNDLAIQSDDKILVVSRMDRDMMLARLNANGTTDTGFGSSGRVTRDLTSTDAVPGSSSDTAKAVAVLSDGKIVIAGEGTGQIAIVRYLSDGSLNSSFGSGGVTQTPLGTLSQYVNDMQVQPDGKLVVVGLNSRDTVPAGPSFDGEQFVFRYTPNGTLDSGFGTAGKVFVNWAVNDYDSARTVLLQPDGKLLVVGNVDIGTTRDQETTLFRLNPNGTLDLSFGVDGKLQVRPTGYQSSYSPAAVLVGDKVLVFSTVYQDPNADFGLMRFWQ